MNSLNVNGHQLATFDDLITKNNVYTVKCLKVEEYGLISQLQRDDYREELEILFNNQEIYLTDWKIKEFNTDKNELIIERIENDIL